MIPALVRDQFPALMADPGIVYLDSAATTRKPRRVIEAATAALTVQTANPRRGVYNCAAELDRFAGFLSHAFDAIGDAGYPVVPPR
jgi:cysteine desulfurase / selenocysteine lyase